MLKKKNGTKIWVEINSRAGKRCRKTV